ncbi:MAG TPA: DUF5985 family protein [Candidatus Acidoferrales bacterium]|nr:DUF5985 family protein [Candidatus Acidoferrales bacterium]
MRVEAFLLGVIAITSLTAGLFFLKFWRRTHDSLFLAFSVAFFIEGVNRTAVLNAKHPNEGSPWIYTVRLIAFLIILGGILHKNYGSERSRHQANEARPDRASSISSD